MKVRLSGPGRRPRSKADVVQEVRRKASTSEHRKVQSGLCSEDCWPLHQQKSCPRLESSLHEVVRLLHQFDAPQPYHQDAA
jgi:hypothetical protein